MRQWIAGPLRELVHDTLSQQKFRECGWLNLRTADRLIQDLDAGKPEARDPLWMLLVLGQSYLRHKQRSPSLGIPAEAGPIASPASATPSVLENAA